MRKENARFRRHQKPAAVKPVVMKTSPVKDSSLSGCRFPWNVSVIIPVYNVKPYLEEALDSVLGQTYQDLEILVIDDGSTDGSGLICDRYAKEDPRIRVIHQKNRGLSGARNTGLDNMTGDVVAFLDPDDIFEPDMIRRLVRVLQEKKVDIAVCGVYSFTDLRFLDLPQSAPVSEPKPSSVPAEGYYSRQSFLENMIDSSSIRFSVWNKLYAASLFHGIRFREGHVYEDVDILYRIADRAGSFYAIPDPLVINRGRPGSITKTISLNNYRDYYTAYRRLGRYIRQRTPEDFDEKLKKTYLRHYTRELLNMWHLLAAETTPSGMTFRRKLRRHLLRYENNLPLTNYRAHAKCLLIRFCPKTYSRLYLQYFQNRYTEYQFSSDSEKQKEIL